MYFRFILCATLIVFYSNVQAQVPGAKIGSFDQFVDIGSPAIAGSASYHEPSQTYHITGSGRNIWFGQDSFAFVFVQASFLAEDDGLFVYDKFFIFIQCNLN